MARIFTRGPGPRPDGAAREARRPPHGPERAPGEWIVRLAGRLLPWAERRAWSDEWEAELGSAWDGRTADDRTMVARVALTLRALGALPDALEIRSHHRSNGMLAHDLRFALRRLRFRPGFATLVTLTLALGIGAATTVFTVVDSVLLRPLPFAQPDRLVELYSRMERGFSIPGVPIEALDELEGRGDLFQAVARFTDGPLVLETGEPRELSAIFVSSEFFPVLGVRPRMGRVFAPEEVESGARVAVLSEALWREAMGGDPDAVGRDITLSGQRYSVVGVMGLTRNNGHMIYAARPSTCWRSCSSYCMGLT